MKRRVIYAVVVLLAAAAYSAATSAAVSSPSCQATDAFCYQPVAEKLVEKIKAVNEPNIAVQTWTGAGR